MTNLDKLMIAKLRSDFILRVFCAGLVGIAAMTIFFTQLEAHLEHTDLVNQERSVKW